MSATNVATLRSFYEALNTTAEAPDVIVVTNRFIGRMRHAGLIADFSLTVVVRFRDGLIVRFVGYRERAEALTAVGLGG